MPEELNDEPLVSKIFLRALREFSESCVPPSLHHACPFSVDAGFGIRGCGEECMDILGRYGAPPPIEETVLATGMTVRKQRRPRPRHSATRIGQPFDARGDYLTQRDSSLKPQWSLQSLFFHVKEILARIPSTDDDLTKRFEEVETSKLLMEARGIVFALHVEPSVRKMVGMVLSANVTASLTTGQSISGVDVSEWSHYVEFAVNDPRSRELFGNMPRIPQVITVLRRWAETANLLDLISYAVPSASWTDLIKGGAESELETSGVADGVWLFDRFTETYLDRWQTGSLKREWAYIHGQQSIPCSPYELKSREVNVSELAMVMADRMVRESPRKQRRIDASLNLEMMTQYLVGPAARFLRDGRLTEARALFEAILQTDAESSDANNNLGFCWIPENPDLALKYFDATSQETQRTELLAINRMTALAKLGRLTAFQNIAVEFFQIEPPVIEVAVPDWIEGAGIYLWDINSVLNDGVPLLIEVSDLRSYAQYIFWRVLRNNDL